MTVPAKKIPGLLGTIQVPNGQTGEFEDYAPRDGHTIVTFFVNSNQNGTVDFFRVARGGGGTEKSLAAAVAIVGGTELRQTFNFPLNQVRIRFNATVADTVASCEAIDGGMA